MENFKTLTKEDIRHGDVLLFTPHEGDIIAEAIAFLSNGKVHHAALCYYEDVTRNDKCVMESLISQGLVINYLKDKEARTYPAYVARYNGNASLKPVLDVAKSYFNQKNHYPIPNIVILGALLLTKKLPISTIEAKTIYDFACIIGAFIMDYMKKHDGYGSSMICSQFVSQCFSDALPYGAYDLKFDRLVVFDDETTDDISKESLYSYLDCDNEKLGIEDLRNTHNEKSDFAKIFTTFKSSVENVECNGMRKTIGNPKLAALILKTSLDNYCKRFFGCNFSLGNLQLRNNFVTPQDLFANTKSLSIVGILPYKNA